MTEIRGVKKCVGKGKKKKKKMELRTRQVSPESSFIGVVWIRESHQFWQLSGLNMLAYSRSGDLALKLCRVGTYN